MLGSIGLNEQLRRQINKLRNTQFKLMSKFYLSIDTSKRIGDVLNSKILKYSNVITNKVTCLDNSIRIVAVELNCLPSSVKSSTTYYAETLSSIQLYFKHEALRKCTFAKLWSNETIKLSKHGKQRNSER